MKNAMTVFAFALGLFSLLPNAKASVISDDYSSFWVFGGSMSDNGNVATNRGYVTEIFGTPVGRATNGRVWNEPILAEFDAAGKASGNFAHGGATALGNRNNGPEDDGTVDLTGQVDLFLQATSPESIGDQGLAAIWIGSNDLRDLNANLDYSKPRTLNQQIIDYSHSIAQAVDSAMASMASAGINDFLVFNALDTGKLPWVESLPVRLRDALTNASVAYNDALEANLEAAPYNSTLVDTYALGRLVDETIANGGSIYGVEELGPCVGPRAGDTDCAVAAYWDGVHFTQIMHDQVEAEARAALAQTAEPEPELMLASFSISVQSSAFAPSSFAAPLIRARSFAAPVESFAVSSTSAALPVAPVPLPAACWMLLAGLGGFAMLRQRRRAA
ncbi:MAG: VPLPA-CTERM sorting domain-containing protein [Mangrovicoccus sp.]|nr:VPLPA-CTERM sorting domain-containing protein [Mangrovicoccus sp.]